MLMLLSILACCLRQTGTKLTEGVSILFKYKTLESEIIFTILLLKGNRQNDRAYNLIVYYLSK